MDDIETIPSLETARIILVEKLQEARTTTAYAATIFTFYLGINAVLFKVSFIDNSFTPKFEIQVVAIGTGVVYFMVCIFYWLARNLMLSDINYLNELLGNPLKNEQMLPLKYTALSAGLFTILCSFAWTILAKF
ncbi:MAG: hypothetical protein HAW67_01050 [Endozoicomonadaceae bacterium]|nr:hypothetical protein [Endozoicomonadaceae bacterium]